MTITLSWWLIPVAFVILGFAGAWLFGRSQGDYDMVSPFIGVVFALGGILLAVAFLVGRWSA